LKTELTAERLRELLHYDPETGVFTRRIGIGRQKAGFIVSGWIDDDGYARSSVDGRVYRLHRLAWFYVHGAWPKDEIDHRDGVKTNNRLGNLREADRGMNAENATKARRHNASGLLGVRADGKRFSARIIVKGVPHPLGTFASKEDAHAAYLAAKRQMHRGCTI
jgi:hypothetical protein